jgi:hypothetical protein
MRAILSAAVALAFACASPAFANINLLDGNRSAVQEKAYTMPDGSQAPASVPTDPTTGFPYGPTDPPPLPTGAAQDGADANGVTPLAGAAGIRGWLSALFVGLGQPGAAPCASDAGTCNANALLQRIAQRLTSILAALGTPVSQVVAPTDCGGVIATGGTAQNAEAADGLRRAMVVQNPVSAIEDLYVAVAGAASVGGAGNFADLAPGAAAQLTFGGAVIQTAVSVNAASTGHRFLCTYAH